ncbi:hypothetical protein CPB84DRAFT_1759139 [Gymnopilus junonius]|uniref:NADAR domain-containing protein n=1 Tax=Gymnopilus junonius TaxID=109634 RepID=A0A9P5P0D0_GYMJU|nr:hypothetical protein CPB84DRAFT_1759139 [Gymnopilus junonius]
MQTRRVHSESRRKASEGAPVIPPASAAPNRAPSHRAPTPFIPPLGRDEDTESDEEDEEDRPRDPPAAIGRNASRHSRVRYPTPPPIDANIESVLQPMEPASSSAFGPTGPRPMTPLENPLPPPPRDLYEMTPYKSLLTLPQTTALLTATYGAHHLSDTGAQLGLQPTVKRKKSGKGLFRAFSKRDKQKEPEQPRVQFIPIFVPPKDQQSKDPQLSATQPDDLTRSMSRQSRRPPSNFPAGPSSMPQQNTNPFPTASTGPPTGVSFNPGPSTSSSATPRPQMPPVPPFPSSPPAIRFDQESLPFSAFLNHSPHRIIYRNAVYPSALHLYEAMKFIDYKPEIAEVIRNVPTTLDVYPVSVKFQNLQRPDWSKIYLSKMEEVLTLKVNQHPDLRKLLLDTVDARIIYTDPNDTYWGSGMQGQGNNELGKVLVRVRDRLRTENL